MCLQVSTVVSVFVRGALRVDFPARTRSTSRRLRTGMVVVEVEDKLDHVGLTTTPSSAHCETRSRASALFGFEKNLPE